uniref:Uncharacterized protein n=1 Tax=Meloidogyne floridensis TaxID=298350 RepID=A0A915P2P2_9BILA
MLAASFRLQHPSPLAVLVFEVKDQKETKMKILNKWTNKGNQKRENFDLVEFMLEFGLEKSLIGLNWALINADPFSIEKERLEGLHDNCHSLIIQKLITDQRWHFVQTFPVSTEMDSSLSVSFIQQKGILNACCRSLENREDNQIFLDPLSDLQLPTNALLNGPPSVTSMRPIEMSGEPAYQRASRHYIVFRDERFSLMLIDPNGKKLYWLIVDISADGLNSGNFADSITVANYIPPIPNKPGECFYAVFMLFRQPKAVVEPLADFYDFNHPLRQKECKEELCEYRMDFDIEQFKAIHRLQFSAINWAKICFDLFEAARQISIIWKRPEIAEGIDRTAKTEGKRDGFVKARKIDFWNTKTDKAQQIEAICKHFPVNLNNKNNYQSECLINEYLITTTSSAKRTFSKNRILLNLIVILMFWLLIQRIRIFR